MTGLEALNILARNVESLEIDTFYECKGAYQTLEKSLKALEIIKRFIWVEDGKLKCGRFGDVEIELDESDFESKEEFNLLKEVLE